MRIVAITASIDERRPLLTPSIVNPEVSYLAFTDRPRLSHPVWKTIVVDRADDDPVRDAKRFKVRPELFVPEDVGGFVWVDRHCRLMCDPVELFREFEEDVIVVEHYRGDIFSEAKACLEKSKDEPGLIQRTVETFRLEGFPRKSGLFYGGFIAKRRSEASDRFSRLWENYVAAGSRRDQLSLPVAIERSGVTAKKIRRGRMREFFHIRGK